MILNLGRGLRVLFLKRIGVKIVEKDLLLNTFEHRWMAGWFQISRGALLKIHQANRVNAEVAPCCGLWLGGLLWIGWGGMLPAGAPSPQHSMDRRGTDLMGSNLGRWFWSRRLGWADAGLVIEVGLGMAGPWPRWAWPRRNLAGTAMPSIIG